MKKTIFFKLFVSVLAFSTLFTSCTPTDTVDPTTAAGPTSILIAGTGLVDNTATIDAGSEFTVNLTATKGGNDLKTVTIQEANVNVDYSRIKINGVAATANPILLFGNELSSLNYKITVKSHSDISAKAYLFTVTDVAGNKSLSTPVVTITTKGKPATITTTTPDSTIVAPGAVFTAAFNVKSGSATIKSVTVQENGVAITDLSRLTYDKSAFTANPQNVLTEDQTTFAKNISVKTPTAVGTYKYTFVFTDLNGTTSSVDKIVKVGENVETIMGALLNSAGPDGTGGLDLDTGKGYGSANSAIEISDLGIDINLPLATNWKQQIMGENGSEVKYVLPGSHDVPTAFKFSDVKTKDQIASLFTQGHAFTLKSGTMLVSNKIKEGDILVVKNGTKYFLLNITKVTLDLTDNTDQYMIDIKK